MMKWILVVMFFGPQGTTTLELDFDSRTLCAAAGDHIIQVHNSLDVRDRSTVVRATCVQRFREMPDGN